MDIGKRIKMIREKLGLTQQEMASKLGYKMLTISRWERGERTPSLNDLSKLAELYGVNLHWLLTGEGRMFRFEVPDIPGIEDDERELLALLRENPELKPLIIKLLKAAKDMEAAVEEIKKISLEKKLSPQGG